MSEVRIVLPPISDGQISNDLYWLTEQAVKRGHETTGGFLGGEYGYGAFVDNTVFMMHPYCWCERDDCPWCAACSCPDGATRYFINGKEVDGDVFFRSGGYSAGDSERVPELECDWCSGRKERSPNFLHKASGSRVSWYKYIGRGMEVDLKADWRSILADCAGSLGGDS